MAVMSLHIQTWLELSDRTDMNHVIFDKSEKYTKIAKLWCGL